LQWNDTLLIKRKALGEHAASPHPDGTLHGKRNICFIGNLVQQLDQVKIRAGEPQSEESVFLGGNNLGQIALAGKYLDTLKVQGVVNPLDGNSTPVRVKDPEFS